MMKKVTIFSEIGIGNRYFCSSEIEKGALEHRIKGFVIPKKIEGVYLRIWLGKRVYAISSNRFFNSTKKSQSKVKIIFGIEGRG